MIADDTFEQSFRLLVLLLLAEGAGGFAEGKGAEVGIIVSERHDQQGGDGVGVALLFEPAQADLELCASADFGGGAGSHLAVGVGRVVKLLLVLPGPANAVAS